MHNGLQKGSTARLQELVQAWPNAAKEDLCRAILHQVRHWTMHLEDTKLQLNHALCIILDLLDAFQVTIALASFHAEVEGDDMSAEAESEQVKLCC